MQFKNIKTGILLPIICLLSACVDDQLVLPQDGENEELFILALAADEGGTSEAETDFGLEIEFQDYFGELPEVEVVINFMIADLEGFNLGTSDDQLHIKEVIYEIDDCNEGELDFTFNSDGSGSITLSPDAEIGMIEAFEIVFNLPFETVLEDGEEEDVALSDDDVENGVDRSFVFEITNISSDNEYIVFNPVRTFEFVLLDDETIATKWELDIEDPAVFENFKEALAPINSEMAKLNYDEVEKITFEFEYEEMKIEIELVELEDEPDDCDPDDFSNKVIAIEADYDAEDGELELEGSYLILNEEYGEPEDELDFILKALFSIDLAEERMVLTLQSLEDEDNFNDEAFYNSENTFQFHLQKD